ncbi:MAG: hypothetical protein LBU66_03460 [Treponema sp.]|jgi:hypothetical protein|nr:hypothetical protein [Treponema sp.]
MKKSVLFLIFLIIALSVSAQGFYFDIGGGLGGYYSNDSVSSDAWVKTYFGIAAGYGPFDNIPLFFIGDLDIDAFSLLFNMQQYFKATVGVIYYPIPLIQLGATVGTSILVEPPLRLYENFAESRDINSFNYFIDNSDALITSPGFAWKISAAIDLGKKNHGLLIGLNYSGTLNEISYKYQMYLNEDSNNTILVKSNNLLLQSHYFDVFVKYAYRNKTPKQTVTSNDAE